MKKRRRRRRKKVRSGGQGKESMKTGGKNEREVIEAKNMM